MNWEGCSVFTHTNLQEVWLCIFLCVFLLESHSGALMRVSFQFKALTCMCEMYRSGVKCSVVPSRMRNSTHRFFFEDSGVGCSEKEISKKGENLDLTEDRNPSLHGHNRHTSLLLFRPLSSLPSFSFCSPFCPLQIMERDWALTPMLFEMEEINVQIAAYKCLLLNYPI